jgi:S1-C subfamily serine protease
MSHPSTPPGRDAAVDPTAADFGRPEGVHGSFDPAARQADVPPASGGEREGAQVGRAGAPSRPLAEAFGRPDDAGDTPLQRPPWPQSTGVADEPAMWGDGARTDPWRDPGASAMLGAPAAEARVEAQPARPAEPGPKLSVPDVLFGRRVKATALAVLMVVVLALGAVGGVIGWVLARAGNSLTGGSVTLAQVDPRVQRAPNSVAAVAARVSPAVVSLQIRLGNGGETGSGVVIDKKGYVLTNNHVVALAANDPKAVITAVFSDGSRTHAAIVGRDPKTDLAVVKVDVTNPTVIQLGDSSKLRVGDPVIAIGSPLQLATTVTEGIVSALHRPVIAPGVDGDPSAAYDAIQTDAAINHGNSGGALVNTSGALVGVNSAIYSTGGEHAGNIGIGFAIPVNEAARVARSLIHTGSVSHPKLGVSVKSVSADVARGAEIQNVVAGGAAAKAGLEPGDVVTRFGSRDIANAAELKVAVLSARIGATVPVRVVRKGVARTVRVTLQAD